MARKVSNVILVALLLFAFVGAAEAQTTVQAGIFNTGKVLTVKAKPSGVINGVFSGVNVTIRWLTSYGVTLGTASGTYGITAQGSAATQGLYTYRTYGAAPTTSISWAADSENDLFSVSVSGGTGTGTFEICDSLSGTTDNWYFEALGSNMTNNTTQYYHSSTSGVPLPVQLSSFLAAFAGSNQVKLTWTTLSETNCYGFEVQKSQGGTENYQTLPNSFVAGNGTTLEKHTYSYTDAAAASGDLYYRLKQTDKDGGVTYSDGIKPAVVTAVATEKPMPKAFALDQNYPNPFNPSTNIDFALPKDSHVKIEVYNMIGQRVATLVDEVRPVGYYTVSFNAANLASGIYFYRLTTNEVSFLKKMMLLK